MFSLGWDDGGEACKWREELLEDCRLLLANVTLQINVSDIWLWHPDTTGGYSVRSGYQTLSAHIHLVLDDSEKLIWHSQVPSKVSILAWQLLRDGLPTKSNLMNRGIIHVDDSLCVAYYNQIESAQHLFINCTFFRSLWQHVRFWLCFSSVDHNVPSTHFSQFPNYLGGRRSCRSFLQLMWLLCVWLIWKERNNRIFNNVHSFIMEFSEKVKFHAYWWLKANNASFVYGCEQWWSNPLCCLGISHC